MECDIKKAVHRYQKQYTVKFELDIHFIEDCKTPKEAMAKAIKDLVENPAGYVIEYDEFESIVSEGVCDGI